MWIALYAVGAAAGAMLYSYEKGRLGDDYKREEVAVSAIVVAAFWWLWFMTWYPHRAGDAARRRLQDREVEARLRAHDEVVALRAHDAEIRAALGDGR